MTCVGKIEFRLANPSDANAVATLHSDSWRRHYRGAYSDAFLDGELLEDRRSVWTTRLAAPDSGSSTILAENHHGMVGFAHIVFEDDPTWGALLDNLHVAHDHHRQGIGTRLMAEAARAVLERPIRTGLYLWVLEQNVDAQAFYEVCGGRCVGRRQVTSPGGVPGRLQGSPQGLRYAWTDLEALLSRR